VEESVAQSVKDKHTSMGMQHVRFAKEEIDRRKKSPILVTAEEVEEQLKYHSHIYIVDPRLGFNQRTFRFWINHGGIEEAGMRENRTLGHRHSIEAVIYIAQGKGYSVIDGIQQHWETGDLICVPFFAWHLHHNEADEAMIHFAATTGPYSMAMGTAIYEDDRFPEYWVYAQKGEESMKTLIPGGAEQPPGERVQLDQSRFKPTAQGRGNGPSAAELYYGQLAFAEEEEKRRRASKVVARAKELQWGATPMGRQAYAVDRQLGFYVKQISSLFAEVPPGKHSGAHRHLYEETDYVLSGQGYLIVEDQRYDFKQGDTLVIPVFSWHQYFNTGGEMVRFLVHTNRPLMEQTGYLHTQQGEPANYE
jgi:gentisate 1,2-dioxygenase